MSRWLNIRRRSRAPKIEDEQMRAEVRCACGELVVVSDHDDWTQCKCGCWFRIWARVEVREQEWISKRGGRADELE